MKGISIRSKLLLITLVTMLLLVVLSLAFMNTSNRIQKENELLDVRSSMLSEMLSLQHSFQRVVLDEEWEQVAGCISSLHNLELQVASIAGGESAGQEKLTKLKAGQVRSSIGRLVNGLQGSPRSDTIRLVEARTEMVVLGGLMDDLNRSAFMNLERKIVKDRTQLTVTLVLGLFLIGTYLVLFSIYLSRAFGRLTHYTEQLKNGKLPLPLEFTTRDELGKIAGDLNAHSSELQTKIGYINSLTEEGPVNIYKPAEVDELGNALVVLSDYLSSKELDKITRNREDKKQNWISEGVAQVGEVLRSERENVAELSYSLIQKLVTYMNVEMGTLFITSHQRPENPVLELAASYAYDRRKYQNMSLELGEGLPGTCAQEKKKIFLTDVPQEYFEISSGTGNAKPNCLLLVPMMIEEEVYGVIELATVRLLKSFEIEFVESLAESIASSLMAVQTNERTSQLLKQSQSQAVALKEQETALRENMKQLEEAQAESNKQESEIAGILDAINQSTLVAELGLNGRYTSMNDRFLMLLEVQSEQIIGKLHSEFAQVDPYADDYKAFWTSLRKGESVSNAESYKLLSGSEIWLQQSFTPIINNEGNVYKILNIATDITETRRLQEKLETRDAEITRSSLDMQTLNKAVNSALIKCELDAEGIIMEVNEKFAEVTGYGRKELLGRNYRLFLKDTEKEQFEKIWNEVVKEKVYEGVIRRSKPTGEEAWLVSTFSPVINEEGVIYKVYFMGLDITEKKLKYQLLEDANQEIDRLRERLKDYEA